MIVSVGNSRDTSFWHDTWLVEGPLVELLLAIYNNFHGHAMSVHDIMEVGVHNLLQHRLTPQAAIELQHLEDILQNVFPRRLTREFLPGRRPSPNVRHHIPGINAW